MRRFVIAAMSAGVVFAVPTGPSSAQMIRPTVDRPDVNSLITQVHKRYRYGYRRHYYPRRYYAPYYVQPYYAPYYAQPYYAPYPYYAQPYYVRPYYRRPYYGWGYYWR